MNSSTPQRLNNRVFDKKTLANAPQKPISSSSTIQNLKQSVEGLELRQKLFDKPHGETMEESLNLSGM